MQNLLDKINSHPRATLLATGSGIFIVATVVIIAMISSLQNNLVSPAITPEEEKMVLSEVIRNNPKGLINNSQAPVNTSNPIPTGNQIPVETPTQPGIGNPNPEAPQPEPPVAPNPGRGSPHPPWPLPRSNESLELANTNTGTSR